MHSTAMYVSKCFSLYKNYGLITGPCKQHSVTIQWNSRNWL